jgi:hypothetical protein
MAVRFAHRRYQSWRDTAQFFAPTAYESGYRAGQALAMTRMRSALDGLRVDPVGAPKLQSRRLKAAVADTGSEVENG